MAAVCDCERCIWHFMVVFVREMYMALYGCVCERCLWHFMAVFVREMCMALYGCVCERDVYDTLWLCL